MTLEESLHEIISVWLDNNKDTVVKEVKGHIFSVFSEDLVTDTIEGWLVNNGLKCITREVLKQYTEEVRELRNQVALQNKKITELLDDICVLQSDCTNNRIDIFNLDVKVQRKPWWKLW